MTFIFILLNVRSLSVTCPQNLPSDIGLLQLLTSIGTVHLKEEWSHRLPGQYPGGQDDMALATRLHITCTFLPFNHRELIFAVLSNTLDRNQIDFIKIFITGIPDMSPFTSLCS